MASGGAGEFPAFQVGNDCQIFVDDTVIERLEGGVRSGCMSRLLERSLCILTGHGKARRAVFRSG